MNIGISSLLIVMYAILLTKVFSFIQKCIDNRKGERRKMSMFSDITLEGIIEKMQREIEEAKDSNADPNYIKGLERAKDIVDSYLY